MSGASEVLIRQEILKALSSIQDPDLGKDIVSLGFVKNVECKKNLLGRFEVSLDIELTTPACPIKDEFKKLAAQAIAQIDGISKAEIRMTSRVQKQQGSKTIPGIANIIAVGSGKGGVGKSTVAVNLAFALKKLGAKVGLLDADIYGPSLAMMLGVQKSPQVKEQRILPVQAHGIPVMTFAFFAPVGEAVIWRGAMIGKAVEQMLFEVNWGELDYLVIDLPPGTGDVHLSLIHAVDLAGAIVVSTPQEVALLDAVKGLAMFEKLKVPVLGIVENMSGAIFGQGGAESKALERGTPFLGRIPMDAALVQSGDQGSPFVVGHPENPTTQAFETIAKNAAHQMSLLTMKRDHASLGG